MRIGLILLFILSSFGWANAQSFSDHPWVYKDRKVSSYIGTADFYSKITLDYADDKIWLIWEFEGPKPIVEYLATATYDEQETIINIRTWGTCHVVLGCIIKRQGNRTWITFSITNEQLDSISKNDIIKFKYNLENNDPKVWGQKLTGSAASIAQFRQAHPIQQAAYFSEDIKVEYLGRADCDIKWSQDFEGKKL